MKWAVVGKGAIEHVAAAARDVVAALEAREQEFRLEAGLRDLGSTEDIAALDAWADVFVTVGGDGTILYTQQGTSKPVLGINVGAIGFLAEVEPEGLGTALDAAIAGEGRIEERQRLALHIGSQTLPDAINEVTLQTRRIAKLIRFRVEVDGEELDTIRGDGMIVSTPTGSTGYAMSVGGPLLHPGVDGMVLAPIAPFKLAARPWVVPADAEVSITLLDRDSAQGVQQAKVVVDGQQSLDMETGATLTCTGSDRKARYLRFNGGFYERVRTKLAR